MRGESSSIFDPESHATRAQVATVIYRLIYPSTSLSPDQIPQAFSDVQMKQWYATPVDFLRYAGLISGFPDGTFQPDKPVTRAEVAAFYAKALNNGEFTEEQKEEFAQIAAEKYSDMSTSD